jgi:hypothetical protein
MAVTQIKALALLVREKRLDLERFLYQARASWVKSRLLTRYSGPSSPVRHGADTSTGPKPCSVNSTSDSSNASPGVIGRNEGENH